MPVDHRERAFEAAIEHHLLTASWLRNGRSGCVRPRACDLPRRIHRFRESDAARSLASPRKTPRHGDRGGRTRRFDQGPRRPSRGAGGDPPRLQVLRQTHPRGLFRSGARDESRIADGCTRRTASPSRGRCITASSTRTRLTWCLRLNGIPVATAELKNPLTGQNCRTRQAPVQERPRSPRTYLRVQATVPGAFRG